MKSLYGAGEITPAQKFAEMVCDRDAAFRNEFLPDHFWNHDRWKTGYVKQILHANRILKLYEPDAVFSVLQANPRIRSLAPKFVVELVRAEQDKIDSIIKRADKSTPVEIKSTSEGPRQKLGSANSIMGKLNGEEKSRRKI